MRWGWLAAACLTVAGCGGPPSKTETSPAKREEKVPEQYKVRFDTSKGPVQIQVVREFAPRGADRFYELVKSGFFDEARFFRVVPKFVVQFGLNKDPKLNELWRQMEIRDDPVKIPNRKGTITFASRGPGTRTTQVFINLADNRTLDSTGFAPFGRVIEGMDNVEKFYSGYGESMPRGNGPDQNLIQGMGNEYLERSFPRLDYIKTARVE